MTLPHERLDQAMNERRLQLRMSWGSVAKAADLSEAGIRAIRRGTYTPTDLTKRNIEVALKWSPSSIDRILDGEDPIPAITTEHQAQQLLYALQEELRILRQAAATDDARQIVDNMLHQINEFETGSGPSTY